MALDLLQELPAVPVPVGLLEKRYDCTRGREREAARPTHATGSWSLAPARQGGPGAWTRLDAALDDPARAGPLRLMATRAARAEADFLAGRTGLAREAAAGLDVGGARQSPRRRASSRPGLC